MVQKFVVGGGWVLRPISVLSFEQAEQQAKLTTDKDKTFKEKTALIVDTGLVRLCLLFNKT